MSMNQVLAQAFAKDEVDVDTTAGIVAMEAYGLDDDLHAAELALIETETAIELTENAAVALESIATVVEASQENGGMSAESAALLAVSVSSIMTPFGGQDTSAMPSMEAYEGDGGRAASTTVALEGIKETIISMWAAVVKMFKKAVAAVVKWWNENLSNVARLQSGAEALSKAAKESKGTPKETDLPVKSPEYIFTGKKADGLDPKEILKVSKSINAEAFIVGAQVFLKTLQSAKADSAAASNSFLTEVKENIAATSKVVAAGTKMDTSDKRFNKSGYTYYDSESIYPGNAFGAWVMGAEHELSYAFMQPVVDKNNSKPTAPALNKDGIVSLADAVVGLCKAIARGKQAGANLLKLTDDMAKAGSDLMQTIPSDAPATTKAAVNFAIKKMKMVSSNSRNGVSGETRYSSKLAAAAYGFAKASYSNLKTAKAEKEDK